MARRAAAAAGRVLLAEPWIKVLPSLSSCGSRLPKRTFCSTPNDGIRDFQEEMQAVFGAPLVSDPEDFAIYSAAGQSASVAGLGGLAATESLSHVDASGKAAMVDVSGKAQTTRVAVASASGYANSRHPASLWSSGSASTGFGCKQGLQPEMVSQNARLHMSVKSGAEQQEVVIAIGGNIGNRVQNFRKAMQLMQVAGVEISGHACLYESAPAYVTDQPAFLNSAVRARTRLNPEDLLLVLKNIENNLGRVEGGIRFGPRPIDLDIIFYGNSTVTTENLQIPHCRFAERPFVLAPAVDLLGPDLDVPGHWSTHSSTKGGIFQLWQKMGGESQVGKEGLKRVMPVGDELIDWWHRTHVMGILNVTPDSFSDGGKYTSVAEAVAYARAMALQGADIIDVGAQSTRPNATRLSTDEELGRLLPVLEGLKRVPELEKVILSVDTFDAVVAREAVGVGAAIINDVSGGCMDPEMYKTAASLGVPYVLMHMRGNPMTMQSRVNLTYDGNVCKEVGREVSDRLRDAQSAGVPAWSIITDPGIGFAKSQGQNLEILRNLDTFRQELMRTSVAFCRAPIMIGPSRKKFLGQTTGIVKAEDRDAATIAAVTVGVMQGANIVRVHNVGSVRDAVKVADAICRDKEPASERGEHQTLVSAA